MNTKIILDEEDARSPFSFVCGLCKHRLKADYDINPKQYWRCKAFLSEIPVEIWEGKNDHMNPYPGDNGIQFEPIKLGVKPLLGI